MTLFTKVMPIVLRTCTTMKRRSSSVYLLLPAGETSLGRARFVSQARSASGGWFAKVYLIQFYVQGMLTSVEAINHKTVTD